MLNPQRQEGVHADNHTQTDSLHETAFGQRPRAATWIAAMVLGSGLTAGFTAGCEQKQPQPESAMATRRTTAEVDLRREIPSSLTLDERVLAIGTDLDLFSSGKKCGRIEQQVLSWGTQFRLTDLNGELIATAKQRALSWGVEIEIFDSSNNKIGTVEEQVLKSMFSIKSQYAVKGPTGEQLARSEKLDFAGTSVTVKDLSGDILAEIERGMFNIGGDKWHIEFSGDLDRRVLIFIAAYKTFADNSK